MARLLLALLGAALLATALLANHGRTLLEPVSETHEPRLFDVPPGAALGVVTRRLEGAGLVRSARATTLLARYEGIETKLQVGEYELSPDQSPHEILDVLTSGRVKTYPVTLPEGLRATEIAIRLEEAGLADAEQFMSSVEDQTLVRALDIPSDSVEGYLYPDTYHLPRNLEPQEMVRILVQRFEEVWEESIEPLAAASTLSKDEIVTLASIVEKETAAPEERPLIAAVFLNRLRKGMRLETDPTVIYGIEDFDGNIRRSHLTDASNPYNTYRIRGLPPGAIASPGVDALLAVVSPSETDYLYFVSKNNGTHYFSSTYREHVNAVNRYQKRSRRR